MSRAVEVSLWLLALVLLALAGSRVRAGVTPAPAPAPEPAASSDLPSPSAEDLARAALVVATTDPFRIDRRPAEVPFGEPEAGTYTAGPFVEEVAPEVRPSLVGLVGPPWEALLQGIPGYPGSVLVRPGDTLGEFIVRAVGRDHAILQSADTTWNLTIEESWQ